MKHPERIELAPGYSISRIITGLWQVADIEKEDGSMDLGPAASALVDYAESGFDTFDMADHYGSAELIAGHARRKMEEHDSCLLYTSPSPRDLSTSRMPSSA